MMCARNLCEIAIEFKLFHPVHQISQIEMFKERRQEVKNLVTPVPLRSTDSDVLHGWVHKPLFTLADGGEGGWVALSESNHLKT